MPGLAVVSVDVGGEAVDAGSEDTGSGMMQL
jgi:hypothetical protein